MRFDRRTRSHRRPVNASTQSLEQRCLLTNITVTSLADNMDVDGQVTLREAIHAANTDTSMDGSEVGSGGDRIVFAPGLTDGNLSLQLGQLRIEESLIIQGSGVTIDAQAQSRIFKISADANAVTLADLTLQNGFHSKGGGAIQSSSDSLTVKDSIIEDNVVRGSTSRLTGGAIYANSVEVIDSTLRNNSVQYTGAGEASTRVAGGGIYADVVSLVGSKVSANSADGAGGGFISTDTLTVVDSEIHLNTAPVGAGIYLWHSGQTKADRGQQTDTAFTQTIDASSIEHNVGPAVTIDAHALPIFTATDIRFNSGHGIESLYSSDDSAYHGSVQVQDSVIANNDGSGIHFGAETQNRADVYDSTIDGNQGAGISKARGVYVDGSTISNNQQGGVRGIDDGNRRRAGRKFEFRDSTISGNVSEAGAAAIDIQLDLDPTDPMRAFPNAMALTHVTVVNNTSAAGLPAIRGSQDASLNAVIANNSVVASNHDVQGRDSDLHCEELHDDSGISCHLVGSVVGVVETTSQRFFDFANSLPIGFWADTSLLGTTQEPLEPQLGSLLAHDNGPASHALVPGSPAIGLADIDHHLAVGPDSGSRQSSNPASELLAVAVPAAVATESSGQIVFDVWASALPAQGETATATFEVVAGTATEGTDFTGLGPITVTFTADSSVRQQVVVEVLDDVNVEQNETLELRLVASTGFETVPMDPAVGTILNDDRVQVSVGDASIVEGDSGSRDIVFEVTADLALESPFEVQFTTLNRTASAAAGDFVAVNQTLQFQGIAGETHTVRVPVNGDTIVEPDERFAVQISLDEASNDYPNVGLGQELAFGTIFHDEVGAGIDGRELVVIGTENDDSVALTGDGEFVVVNLNGSEQTFAIADIDSIFVGTFDGTDVITADGDLLDLGATIEAGDGSDIVNLEQASLAGATVFGGAGDDTVTGSQGADELAGGGGDDFVDGAVGADSVSGGIGDDTLIGGDGNDSIDGGEGNDRLDGDAGEDLLLGGGGQDEIYGGADADQIQAGGDADYVNGGAGDDIVSGGSGSDTLLGAKGRDTLDAGLGDDTINGGDGNDSIIGGEGLDEAFGEAGNDYIFLAESVLGGSGDDEIQITNRFTFGPGNGSSVLGGRGDDTIRGGSFDDTLRGGSGHDLIMSAFHSGANQIYGDAGNDTLSGGFANDTLFGGSGDDRIHGGEGDDLTYGESGDDSLFGGDGKDLLVGGAGSDYITGDRGDDTLTGGNGQDVIFGGGGRDSLNGNGGSDLLSTSVNAFDSDPEVLQQVMIAWTTGSYGSRVANTRALLTEDQEAADGAADVLATNEPGRDWYLVDGELDVFSVAANEILDELV